MDILEKLKDYYCSYKGEKAIIGKSYKNREIYAFHVRKSESPKIIVSYAIHGREYITSYLAMKQLSAFSFYGRRGDVWFLPIVNPDGVYLSLYHNPQNKANSRCVDLNVNFDADWGKGKKNVFFPSFENYVGSRPFSEKETRFIKDFTLKFKPDLTVSYHSKGEEIYFEYRQERERYLRDKKIADTVKKVTGYTVKSTPDSCGGYKDWCISELKIPALTIEVGSDDLSHPITEENLPEIYQKNKGVIFALTEIKWLKNLWTKP